MKELDKYYVEIVSFVPEKILKRMGPFFTREAEKIASGAGRNLNHNDYFVRVVPE